MTERAALADAMNDIERELAGAQDEFDAAKANEAVRREDYGRAQAQTKAAMEKRDRLLAVHRILSGEGRLSYYAGDLRGVSDL